MFGVFEKKDSYKFLFGRIEFGVVERSDRWINLEG